MDQSLMWRVREPIAGPRNLDVGSELVCGVRLHVEGDLGTICGLGTIYGLGTICEGDNMRVRDNMWVRDNMCQGQYVG